MCVFMASGGIVFFFFPSVSVYNGFGLRNKLRDGPLHNEKARGCFFSPCGVWYLVAGVLTLEPKNKSPVVRPQGFVTGGCTSVRCTLLAFYPPRGNQHLTNTY